MSYTVLARKYRPQTFSELVGQEHVARTLANAIATGRVAHAFLFTGVRGVGKTTTARLLAKALQCEKGPTPEPCNVCAPCKEITQGVDIDVLEMDGASNNSVDDVRRLQESLPYRPARDRFKVVIVDEVHMLSQGAFNAFLKTLEEPPSHVKFIFATTESHKVPITIRSRCQRYDFRLIPQSVIAGRVREILVTEGIATDDDAVAIVAREAAGSMRDALTLLDQIVAFAGNELRGEEVAHTLGIAARKHVHESVRCVLEGDGAALLRAVDALAEQGADMLHFAKQVVELARDLVVLRVTGEAGDLVDLVDEELTRARELAERVDALELQRCFAALSKIVDDVARAALPKTVLEMGLLRIATRPPLRQVSELLARLDEIERRLDRGPGGAPPAGGRGEGGRPPRPASSGGRSMATSASPIVDRAAPITQSSDPLPPIAETSPAPSPPEPTPLVSTNHAAEPASPRTDFVPPSHTVDAWERIVTVLRQLDAPTAAIVEHGVPVSVTAERVVIGFDEGSFFGRRADSPESRGSIAQAAREVLGTTPAIEVTFDAQAKRAGTTLAQLEATRRTERREAKRQEALTHPQVIEAMRVFEKDASHVQVHIEGD